MTLLLIANRAFALNRSRRALIQQLLRSGYDVVCLSSRDDHAEALEALGCKCLELDVQRGGPSVWRDVRSFFRVFRVMKSYRPALVHCFHVKPLFFSALASLAVPTRLLITITGVGESLPDRGWFAPVARNIYRFACRRAGLTVFQNSDDFKLFHEAGIVPPERARLICSSGVDVGQFVPLSGSSPRKRVLMMCRLLQKKGLFEFIAAARIVRDQLGDSVQFEVAGEWELDHPDAIQPGDLDRANVGNVVQFLGYCHSPETWLQGALCFVCPSVYREGVPRVILEASACGVPVVGTDAPGIRDVIEDGRTGVLLHQPNARSIAAAVLELASDVDRASAMGSAARAQMVEKFSLAEVTRRYLALYQEMGVQIGAEGL